jgi:transcriptional regulator with XRE-family HTH domain
MMAAKRTTHYEEPAEAPRRGSPREKLKLKPDTPGLRLARLRDAAKLTQQQVADRCDRGRSAIAQWERDDSQPDYDMCETLAEILDTTPQYIAFGVTAEPKVVMPDADTMGFAIVNEIIFGDKPTDVSDGAKWAVPVQWLKAEMQVVKPDALAMYKVEAQSGPYEYGDRAIVDRAQTRISPPGHFLLWDGVGPMVAHVSAVPGGAGRKTMARVSGVTGDYEIDAEKLHIIGKVKGVFKKA